jgi:hypothetical protein
MYEAEVVGGSGEKALTHGRISRATYERAVGLWSERLEVLRNHQPSLVHVSPFLWSIYLDHGPTGWRVIKLTSVGDFLWWDPAYDVACLRYPPFGEMQSTWWEGFCRGYGVLGQMPEPRRLLLYTVMQRLMAAMGTYMEPPSDRNTAWAARALDNLDALLDGIGDGEQRV